MKNTPITKGTESISKAEETHDQAFDDPLDTGQITERQL